MSTVAIVAMTPTYTYKPIESELEAISTGKSPPFKYQLYWKILIHICLITLYTAASVLFVKAQWQECKCPGGYNGLSHRNMRYEPQLFWDLGGSGLASTNGEPSAEVDEAWHELMKKMDIRVSEEELMRNNQTSVALPGGGYLAWLEVYHSLHCLKRMRTWNYREHYFPNMTGEPAKIMRIHIDHCIERVRQAVMCHPDLSLTTFEWTEDNSNPMLNIYKAPHMCVDWDDLMSSVEDRIVGSDELRSMVNPILVAGN